MGSITLLHRECRVLGLLVLALLAATAVAGEEAGKDVVAPVRTFIVASVKKAPQRARVPGVPGKSKLIGADEKGLTVETKKMGKLEMPWKMVDEKGLFQIGSDLLKDDDVPGHLAMARLGLKLGLAGPMDQALARLQLSNPDASKEIAAVRGQIAAAKPKGVRRPANRASKQLTRASRARRINHAGRPLPPLPKFKQPILFNTPQADAIVSALQVFPKDNAWNQDISKHPVLPNSDAMVAAIGAEKHVHTNRDMNYVIVPPNQARVNVNITAHKGESDKGPYPVPDNAPIEGWPANWGAMQGKSLAHVQRNGDGDRHLIVLDPWNMMLYEFFVARRTDRGWQANCEATFNLATNKLRPAGWTSADAAGLPIFPAIPRYDECERGVVEHALRFTVPRTRRGYIHPARHDASRRTDANLPAMGQRFRLKTSVNITRFPKHARAVAQALKTYGMFVVDHGSAWYISTPPDDRLKGMNALHKLKGSDFEAVQTVARGRAR